MSMLRTQFQRHLFPIMNEIIMDKYREKPLQYSQIFNVEKSDSAFEEFRTVAGLGLFVRTPEAVESSQDRFYDGFPKRFDHVEYSLSIGLSHQFLRDIKTKVAKMRSMDMGRSARSTQEEINASMLNLAYDGATLGPDGQPLCSTVHPNIRGGTQSNIIDPTGVLTVTSFRLALTKMRRFFDDTGVRRINLDPKWLVVPPEEEFNALEIIKSVGRPDTANRADNVTRNRAEVFCYDYLSDTANWWLLADKGQHFLQVFNREMFHVTETEEERPRIIYVTGYYSQSYGFTHWMGVVGSGDIA